MQHDFCLDLFAPLPPPPIAIDRLNKLVDEKSTSHNGCRSDHIFHSRWNVSADMLDIFA